MQFRFHRGREGTEVLVEKSGQRSTPRHYVPFAWPDSLYRFAVRLTVSRLVRDNARLRRENARLRGEADRRRVEIEVRR